MSRDTQSTREIIVGGEPRVDLLPPEVTEAKKARRVRRRLLGMFLLVAAATGLAYAGAFSVALVAEQSLNAENDRTSDLLTQQAQYAEVRTTIDRLATAEAARTVGSSTEIDFATLLSDVSAGLPVGASIVTVSAETGTPLQGYPQATIPLQPQRIATVTFTIKSANVNDVEVWLVALAAVEGYADAVPGQVTRQDDGTYLSSVVLRVNSLAYSDRFAPEPEVAVDATDAGTESTGSEGAEVEG